MFFGPFGRTQQAGFLSVPAGINNGAPRLPSCLSKLTERIRFFHHGSITAQRICSAKYPAVHVVAAKYPLVGIVRTLHFGNNVVERNHIPVKGDLKMNLGGAGSDMISNGKSAAPRSGCNRTLHGF